MPEWPLVGRQVELDRVAGLLVDTQLGGVVLAGPPGVGKTRLATECAAVAEQAGFVSRRVTGTRSAAAIPFGAVAPLLHSIDGLGDDQAVVLRRAAEELSVVGGDHPLFLVVDDAHLLDDASITLVHHVVSGRQAFVVATVRLDAPVPDPILALWKDELAARIELGPLDADDVRTLLAAALGGTVDPDTAARLHEASGGNVLFLRELVVGAIESGSLVEEGGRWRLAGSLTPSRRLVELIDSRLGTLPASARRALEVVAVAESIELGVLETLAAPFDIEDLDRRQLIGVSADGGRLQAKVAHPLYGEVLRARLPVTAARAHQRALADAFEAREVAAGDALRVALWRLAGGGPLRPEAMAAAAAQARGRFDFELAERLARAAHQAGAGLDNALLLASVLGATGRGEEADELLADSAALATTDKERTMLALVRMDDLAYGLDRYDDAIAMAESAASTVRDPERRAELEAKRAYLILNAGRLPEALVIAEPLLQRRGRAFVWAALAAGWAYGASGRLEQALTVSRAGAEAQLALPADEAAHLWHPMAHALAGVLALAMSGDLREAERRGRHEYDQAVAYGSTEIRAWFAWSLARTSAGRGDIDGAARWANEAVTTFRQLRNREAQRWSLAELAMAKGAAGRAGEAVAAVADLDALPGEPVGWLRSEFSRARAWCAVASNDLAAARHYLAEAATTARGNGESALEVAALLDLVRLGDSPTARDRLAELAAIVEGPLAPAALAFAEAAVTGDGRALERAGEVFAVSEALLVAAEAFSAAAVAFLRAGEPRRAAVADERAVVLAARCPGAKTPGLANPVARQVLSPREYEVAQLAATGLGRRDIADRVGTSIRTVENQLQRAYAKLGVSDRSQLARALERLDNP